MGRCHDGVWSNVWSHANDPFSEPFKDVFIKNLVNSLSSYNKISFSRRLWLTFHQTVLSELPSYY
jgi:hypothetical protein